jgi:hypothetical protein
VCIYVELTRTQAWTASLPAHLQYSDDTLAEQLSMFETSSNSGAWCYCMMQIMHMTGVLMLARARAAR